MKILLRICAILASSYEGLAFDFTFIEMGSQCELEEAIKAFHGTSLNLCQIKANKAHPPDER